MAIADERPAGSRPEPLDVLVVGAGPTGLALAAVLQSYGVRFRIVDRQVDRVRESRALAVQPRTLEVLAPLGLTDAMVARGSPAVRLKLHVGDRTLPLQLFDIGIDDTAYPYLLFLSQAETEAVMGEHLTRHGVRIERGVELLDLKDDAATPDAGAPHGTTAGELVGCRLRHRDGRVERVTARYVVGCDGPGSTVRDAAGIAFEGSAYPQSFVLADLEADGVEPGSVHAFLAPRGILFFFPLGSPATWRLLAMRPTIDAPPVDRPVTLEEVQRLTDGYVGGPVHLHSPVWMTNFRLHHRSARQYRAGPVFVAGDAAHIHSPAGAQGMNTGIQDAVNLGWKLGLVLRGRADPSLLDTYEPERAPVGRTVLRFTDRAFTAATSTNVVVRFARTRLAPRLLPLLFRIRAGRRYAFRTVSELAIRYRSSPASVEAPDAPRDGPRAGDRLPDAPVVLDGEESTLHRNLATAGYHLVVCGPAKAWPDAAVGTVAGRYAELVTVHRLDREPAPGVLHDPSGLAHRRLGLSGGEAALILVRPDGYVAYRSGPGGLAGLRTYLASWLR